MSLKDQILSANDCKLEPVLVPEWNATVYVPMLSVGEALEIQKATEGEDSAAKLATFIIRDEQGNRVFTEAEAPALAKKSMAALKRIVDAFNQLNGEDAEKN